MKKALFTCLAIIFIFQISFAQGQEKYTEMINQAWKLYTAEDYLPSGQKYSQAFDKFPAEVKTDDRYNAACTWALAQQTDSAFVQLSIISTKGNYSNLSHISSDSDLKSLYNDARWETILEQVKENKKIEEANYDQELLKILEEIYNNDQEYRLKANSVEEVFGWDSKELRDVWKTIHIKDSMNVIQVSKILDERGWLGADIIGKQGNLTLFLVIQHAELAVQEKYLPMLREAAKDGRASASFLALMEDRVAMRKGKKQIYGSQVGQDPETGEHFIHPMIDPDHVNERRAKVGLQPIEDYITIWNMTWNVEDYKKRLTEKEAKKASEIND